MTYDSLATTHVLYGEDDYESVRAAVAASPRGRWFLAEYVRRYRTEEADREGVIAHIGEVSRNSQEPVADDALTGELAEIVSTLATLREMDDARARQLTELVHHLERRIASMMQAAEAVQTVPVAAAAPVPETQIPQTPIPQTHVPSVDTLAVEAARPPEAEPEIEEIETAGASAIDLLPVDFTPPPPKPAELAKPLPESETDNPFIPPSPWAAPTPPPAKTSPFARAPGDLADLEHELFPGVQAPRPAAAAGSPSPPGRAAAPQELTHDPLAAFKAMSAEEKIALFS